MASYPLDLPHPNGVRSVTVFSAEEHRAAQAEFQRFRQHHAASARAALEGRDAPAPLPVRSDEDDLLVPPSPLEALRPPPPEPLPNRAPARRS